MNVLVVEDNRDLADTLRIGLEEVGYRVTVSHNGIEGEVLAQNGSFDLLLVDWMLPGRDGPSLVCDLREAGVKTPILMLTARAEHADQVEGLDAGADDYLTKPFSFDVLVARLRALARRGAFGNDRRAELIVEAGRLRMDIRNRTAHIAGRELVLREKEFKLLVLLAENAGRAVTRTTIAERVWANVFITDDVLNTTIASLRKAVRQTGLSAEEGGVEIETMRGVGYRLRVLEAAKRSAAA
ncbi:MAG: response regulator transcription factor [Bacteroidota bacterium]